MKPSEADNAILVNLSEEAIQMAEQPIEEAVKTGEEPNIATMQEENVQLAEEVASLKEEIDRLESEEHSQEVIAHWLSNLDMADPEARVELGVKLGLDKMFREAEVADEEPGTKTRLLWKDPGDEVNYGKVTGLPIWVLKEA